ITVSFTGPLSVKKKDRTEIERENRANGAQGKTLWWLASTPDNLAARLKRYEALKKVLEDERFTREVAKETRDALAEKRRERDELESALARELEKASLRGHVYYGGHDVELHGERDLKRVLQEAGKSWLAGLYHLFGHADRAWDFKCLGK